LYKFIKLQCVFTIYVDVFINRCCLSRNDRSPLNVGLPKHHTSAEMADIV